MTWGNGAGGTTGTVSGDNSLVGTYAYDQVGRRGVTALANGNYVVDSDLWGDDAGAVTFGDGTKGVSGPVSSANSLVGGTSNLGGSQGDEVGGGLDPGDGQEYGGVTALPNGNYVIVSAYGLQTGTVTWGNGTTGTLGTVSSANSFTGATAGGSGVVVLPNDDYIYWVFGIGGSTCVWFDGSSGTTLDGENTPDAQNTFEDAGLGSNIQPIGSGGSFIVGRNPRLYRSQSAYLLARRGPDDHRGSELPDPRSGRGN